MFYLGPKTLQSLGRSISGIALGLTILVGPACKTSTTQAELNANTANDVKAFDLSNFKRIFASHATVAITNGGTVPLLLAENLKVGLLRARVAAGGYPSSEELKNLFVDSLTKSDKLYGNNPRSARLPNPNDPSKRENDLKISDHISKIFRSVITKAKKDMRISPSAELGELISVLDAITWPQSSEVL